MNLQLHEVAPLSAALSAGLDTGLLKAMVAKPGSPAELAVRCGLDGRACARVIEVLDAFDLTTREGDNRGAGAELAAVAARAQPIGRLELELWRHAPVFLKTGEPLFKMDASPKQREHLYRGIVSELARMFEGAADELAGRIGLAPQSIIDVGCGSGVWSLAIARRHSGTRVTGVDFPAVLNPFRARAETLGLANRIATIEGNMHTVELPRAQWDLLVVANVLRLEPAESARKLVHRIAGAVRPGGSILVVDALADGTPQADRARALYAFHLSLRTRSGTVHSPEEISSWLAEAGFADVAPIQVSDHHAAIGAVGALLAAKL